MKRLTEGFRTLVAAMFFASVAAPVGAVTTLNDGDWTAQTVTLSNTPEAALMVRTGDIDNLDFGWPAGFDPFSGNSTPVHGYPWVSGPTNPQGTDRIMVVTSYVGNPPAFRDGYTNGTTRPANEVRPIVLSYSTTGLTVSDATLQIFVDDFQAGRTDADYQVTINGKRVPSLELLINRLDQTGPIGELITFPVPPDLLNEVRSGRLEVKFDDTTTGAGDGYAIDFVKLLINRTSSGPTGTITGQIRESGTNQPVQGAKVSCYTSETFTDAAGNFTLINIPAGTAFVLVTSEGRSLGVLFVKVIAGQNTANISIPLQPGPEVNLTATGDIALVSGVSAVDCGSSGLGSGNQIVLTLRNSGSVALTDFSFEITGAHAGDFSIVSIPSPFVGAGSSATVILRFSPKAAGNRTAVFRMFSNDSDESPFTVNLKGAGVTPDITVELPDGSSLTDGSGILAFGDVVTGTVASRTLTIRNTGNANMTGISAAIVGTTSFTVGSQPATTLVPGASTSCTINFSPGSTILFGGALQISSNDPDEATFDLTLRGTGITSPAPEVAVEDASGAPLADGSSSIGFERVAIGSQRSITLTVRNTGTAPLSGVSASLEGNPTGEFSITSSPAATVAASGFTTLTVTFAPLSGGERSATLRIASDDANENPYDIILEGIGSSPDIAVFFPAKVELFDGVSTAGFGLVKPGGRKLLTFSIRNPGLLPLTGISLSIDGANAGDFTLVTPPPSQLVAGGKSTFKVAFTPLAGGSRTALLGISSNDPDEPVFEISLAGSGMAPEISVQQPADIELADASGSVDFGTPAVGSSATRVFTIRNTGDAPLKNITATFTGSHAAEFKVGKNPAKQIPAGKTITLSVTFTPAGSGLRSAVLNLGSNDSDENPFEISLQGGQAPAALATAATTHVGLPPLVAADPDGTPYGDGVPNLLKYAFNMNLEGADRRTLVLGTGAAGLPAVDYRWTDGSMVLHFEFIRRSGSGLRYLPKTSTDLETWTEISGEPEIRPIDEVWERVVYEDLLMPGQTAKRFCKVEVLLPSGE